MGEEVTRYIDGKFDSLNANLRWFARIIITVFIIMFGWVSTQSIKNKMAIKDLEFDVIVLNGRTKTLEYRILWFAEINEMVRDYYKEKEEGHGHTVDFLESVQKMEDRVKANSQPMPTLRSGYYKDKK